MEDILEAQSKLQLHTSQPSSWSVNTDIIAERHGRSIIVSEGVCVGHGGELPESNWCSICQAVRPVPNLRNTRLHVMRSSIGINKKLVINIRVSKASSNDCPHRIKVKTTTSAPPTNLLCGMTRPRQGLCWQMRAHRLMVCAELRHLSPSPLTFSRSVPFLELSPT